MLLAQQNERRNRNVGGEKVLNSSLWIVGFGLMLASSGLDGAFLVKLMPDGWGWLGLVLNTTTDIASEVISYWCGRLAQDASSKKRAMSKWLWLAQFALVLFSWLFGWRQIIPILRQIEPQDWQWLSPIMAAFVPTALVAVGYTQALLAGRIEKDKSAPTDAQSATKAVKPVALRRINIDEWREIAASLNGDRAKLTAARVNQILEERGLAQVPATTARYWANDVKG